jgi:hypothetical protein
MAYAVYAEDTAAYNDAKSYFFRTGAQGADNGTVMTAFLNSGQELEMGRDIYYAQLSLGSFLEWARIAYNQGDRDLFDARENVLCKAMEYLGKYNLGYFVNWEPFYLQADLWQTSSPVTSISTSNRGSYRNIWNLAYDYCYNVKKLDMSYSRKIIDSNFVENTSATITDQVGFGAFFFNNVDYGLETYVSVYQENDYNDLEALLLVGNYTKSQLLASGVQDNSISSIKVPAGFKVELFDDDNFQNPLGTFTSDQPNFGELGINDRVTSLRISKVTTSIRTTSKAATSRNLHWANGILRSTGKETGTVLITDNRGRSKIVEMADGKTFTGPMPCGFYYIRFTGQGERWVLPFIVLSKTEKCNLLKK